MTAGRGYTYAALRYVHDVSTGEFVNVGIVLHSPSFRFLGVKLRHTHARLSAVFPDLDHIAFRSSMKVIERALRNLAADYAKSDLFPPKGDAVSFARLALPSDDSSLQWSQVGGGITTDPKFELDRLYDRLVSRYDDKQDRRRTDEDVWRPIREKLDEAKIGDKLVKKVIRSSVDELSFKHAWKNGMWHCYEGLSFDLADADSIKNKARRWNGHLTSVRATSEDFKPYFILGAPSDNALARPFADAIAILNTSPVDIEIFEERESDKLVARIERTILSHG